MRISLIKSIVLNLLLACAVGAVGGLYIHEREKNVQAMAERQAVREVETYIAMNVPNLPAVERRGYAEVIVDAAAKNGIHHSIVASVAIVESHFANLAVSDKDAVGIMQIVPQWWVGVAPEVSRRSDLFSPDINIRAGTWILAHYAVLCGLEQMLSCYESGPRAIDTGYAAKVMKVRLAKM